MVASAVESHADTEIEIIQSHPGEKDFGFTWSLPSKSGEDKMTV
jgi:hypothetical protein